MLQEAVEAVRPQGAMSVTSFVKPTDIVVMYDLSGETVKVFEWLEKAYEGRDNGMLYLAVLPFSERIRSDPRFEGLLRRMKLPH